MKEYENADRILNELELQDTVGRACNDLALIGTVGGGRTAARIADDLCGQLEDAVRLMGQVPASRAKLAKVLVDHVKVLTTMTQAWAADE